MRNYRTIVLVNVLTQLQTEISFYEYVKHCNSKLLIYHKERMTYATFLGTGAVLSSWVFDMDRHWWKDGVHL